MKRFLVGLAVLALVATACGSDDDDEPTGGATGGGEKAAAYTVEIDAKTTAPNIEAIRYFPKAVSVHPGDTVNFHSNYRGEPHTVTFGTIVDEGLNAGKDLGPDTPEEQFPPAVKALDEKLPEMLPEGPGDADQTTANPCFLASGDPPKDAACPKVAQPAFDGKQTVFSSGFLPDQARFAMKLADDIAPGTYNYFCLLHRQGMTGTLTVVPKSQSVPSAADVVATGRKELADLQAKLRPASEQLTKATPANAVAGAISEEVEDGFIAEFGPKDASVPVGGTMAWSIFGFHTVSFNAPEDARDVMVKAPDGTFHLNEKSGMPVRSPDPPPPPEGEPSPEAKPTVVDGGRFDGVGFFSSGLIASFGPPGYQYKLTFTRPGTYRYECLIHFDMEGTVKVG